MSFIKKKREGEGGCPMALQFALSETGPKPPKKPGLTYRDIQ
jgi:hypothetical protein